MLREARRIIKTVEQREELLLEKHRRLMRTQYHCNNKYSRIKRIERMLEGLRDKHAYYSSMIAKLQNGKN